MKTSKIAIIVILFFFSLILSYFISGKWTINLLLILPNIIGILFGGVLASLAIIFGLLSSNELAIIYKLSKKVENKDIYSDFIGKTKIDTITILLSLCLSVLVLLIADSMIIPEWFLLGLDLFGLFISLSAAYDIVMSLFYLNQVRYELAKYWKEENE